MNEEIKSYRDLIVWQKSIGLVVEIYQITKHFPKEELYGLTIQIRRCAISIPSNISEGRGRGTRKDFAQFLRIALGSANELQTQIEIAKRLNYIQENKKTNELLIEIIKMLNSMINKLNFPNS
ncbi:MAG: four helix bundle protein [Patescibacteria group bacterium]